MSEITVRRDDKKDEIVLMRGGREITFKKAPKAFAVRLKRGRASDEAHLVSATAELNTEVKHVDARLLDNLDVFHMDEARQLEGTMTKLRQAPNADVVTHVYTIDDASMAEVIPTGTLTVQFKQGAAKENCEAILAEFGLEIIEALDFIEDGYTVRLTDASTENPLKIARKLQEHPEIEVAEPDITVPASFAYTPVDTLYPRQWHLNNRGDALGLRAGADVKAEQAWEITRGDRRIKICVIDDGFDLGHPEFDQPNKIVGGRDFLDNDFDPTPISINDNHGTACAGVALAEENGRGVVGLAPQCTLIPVRFSNISDNAIVAYFQHAIDKGADVISCSWSATPWNFPLSLKMRGIIRKAATQGRNGKGCVILFAAGNEARPLDGIKNGRISHQGFALHQDVLAVAASNSRDEHASYSNIGRQLTVCAPSSGSPGRRIVTSDRRGVRGYAPGDYTAEFGGTSSSTPLAAGLAALILTIHPDLTSTEVRKIMTETADQIDPNNGGYVDGISPLYGHGRINAIRALERTKEIKGDDRPDGQPSPPNGDGNNDAVISLDILEVILSIVNGQLQVKTDFKVTGTNINASTQVRFRNEFFIKNRATGDEIVVDSIQGHLRPQQTARQVRLNFPYPGIGRYETRSVMTLFPAAGEKKVSHPGNGLQVTG